MKEVAGRTNTNRGLHEARVFQTADLNVKSVIWNAASTGFYLISQDFG